MYREASNMKSIQKSAQIRLQNEQIPHHLKTKIKICPCRGVLARKNPVFKPKEYLPHPSLPERFLPNAVSGKAAVPE